jgi:hypothetical protein
METDFAFPCPCGVDECMNPFQNKKIEKKKQKMALQEDINANC